MAEGSAHCQPTSMASNSSSTPITVDDPPSLARTVRAESGRAAGQAVGATWLGDFALPNETAHMGATAFSPVVWGTNVNPETKLLVLGLAFEHGFGRVKIQADSVNARSRSAIERLGAQFEGILRRDQRRADSSGRDTAVYSVLATEWPAIKAGLDDRIKTNSHP